MLGQVKVDDKSNEIKAILELLRVLALEGCIVTFDALGCQKDIAQTIVERDGDYVLAVKHNYGKLYQDLKDLFAGYPQVHFREVPRTCRRTVNKAHCRLEVRKCWTLADAGSQAYLRQRAGSANLRTEIMLVAQRRGEP